MSSIPTIALLSLSYQPIHDHDNCVQLRRMFATLSYYFYEFYHNDFFLIILFVVVAVNLIDVVFVFTLFRIVVDIRIGEMPPKLLLYDVRYSLSFANTRKHTRETKMCLNKRTMKLPNFLYYYILNVYASLPALFATCNRFYCDIFF